MSFLTSIVGFAGVSPAAVVLAKGVTSAVAVGTEVQQLLPSEADFAALVRALSPGLNAPSEGKSVPTKTLFEPVQQLEETLERILGVPVTVQPVASVQNWGLFEIRVDAEMTETVNEDSEGSTDESSGSPVAFLLARLPPALEVPLPTYTLPEGLGPIPGSEASANPQPIAFLILPNEGAGLRDKQTLDGSIPANTKQAPGWVHTRSEAPIGQSDSPVQVELFIQASPVNHERTAEAPSLVQVEPPVQVDQTAPTVETTSAVNVSQSVLTAAAYAPSQQSETSLTDSIPHNAPPSLSLLAVEMDKTTQPGAPQAAVAVEVEKDSIGLAPFQSLVTKVGQVESLEGIQPKGPVSANPQRTLEGVPEKVGLSEVAKTLRLLDRSATNEQPAQLAKAPGKLEIPVRILEILGAAGVTGIQIVGNGDESASEPTSHSKVPVQTEKPIPTNSKPMELLPILKPKPSVSSEAISSGVIERLELKESAPFPSAVSGQSHKAVIKLGAASPSAGPIEIPVQIIEGEPANRIIDLAAKILGRLTEASSENREPGQNTAAKASPIEFEGPQANSIKPLVSTKAVFVGMEVAHTLESTPDTRPNVLVHPALSSDKAAAMIEESERRVTRSILSTFFSGRTSPTLPSTEPKMRSAKEDTKQVSADKPVLNLAPKADASRALNPRRLDSAPSDRIDRTGERQVEAPIRTSPVSGQTSQVSTATPSTTAASSSGTSSSATNIQNLEVVEQVSQALRSNRGPLGSEIRVRLVPENLGEVHLKIAVKDGTLVAEIRASSEVTREILSREAHKIQALLQGAGAKVEHVVVRTGGFGGEAFETNRSHREPNLPADRDGNGRHSGRDARDADSSQKEKERDPHSPWERWEKFA